MLVEQAVFTSARTKRHQGYQIVARSADVPDEVADFLAKWGPTHGSLHSRDVTAESLNYVPINHDWVAASRTLHGGPEYSARGALQVVTQFLILRRRQLAGFHNNAVTLIRTAQILGHLWLNSGNLTGPTLPTITLPATAPGHLLQAEGIPAKAELVGRALAAMRGNRLALIGAENPTATVEALVRQTDAGQRLDLSFTTGLVPSQHRQFRVHMLPEMDAAMHDRLAHQGIRFIAATV